MAAKPGKWLDDGEKEPWALRRFMGAIGGLAVLLLAGSLDTLCKKKTKTKRFFCHTQSFFSKRWDSFETFRNVSKRFETFFTKFFLNFFETHFSTPPMRHQLHGNGSSRWPVCNVGKPLKASHPWRMAAGGGSRQARWSPDSHFPTNGLRLLQSRQGDAYAGGATPRGQGVQPSNNFFQPETFFLLKSSVNVLDFQLSSGRTGRDFFYL